MWKLFCKKEKLIKTLKNNTMTTVFVIRNRHWVRAIQAQFRHSVRVFSYTGNCDYFGRRMRTTLNCFVRPRERWYTRRWTQESKHDEQAARTSSWCLSRRRRRAGTRRGTAHSPLWIGAAGARTWPLAPGAPAPCTRSAPTPLACAPSSRRHLPQAPPAPATQAASIATEMQWTMNTSLFLRNEFWKRVENSHCTSLVNM